MASIRHASLRQEYLAGMYRIRLNSSFDKAAARILGYTVIPGQNLYRGEVRTVSTHSLIKGAFGKKEALAVHEDINRLAEKKYKHHQTNRPRKVA